MGGLLTQSNLARLTRLNAFVGSASWQQLQWQELQQTGLPTINHEEWKYTSLENFNQLPLQEPDIHCIDNLSYEGLSLSFDCYRLVFFDGRLSTQHSDWIPDVIVTPLKVLTDNEAVSMMKNIRIDEMALLNDATATTGVSIEVRAGVNLKKPIYLFHLNSGLKGELCSYRHHINVGHLASCEVVEHHISLNQGGGVSLSRLTVDVCDGAQFNHTKLVEEGPKQHHFGHNDIRLYQDSTARSTVLMLEGALIRHQTNSTLLRPNSHIDMNSLTLPYGDQVFDSRTFLNHQSNHCSSMQTHKIIAADQSIGVFDGKIHVAPKALKTNGQMNNHNLIIGDKAQVNSKPQLEVYADDVKCSHGATSGQIDKNQIEYLRARGISENAAKQMVMFAFVQEVAKEIRQKSVEESVNERIKRTLERLVTNGE